MAVATLLSRFLGLAREMVYAWFMGTGPVASAFILAYMIPNLFRRLLGEGALTAAFIPLFKQKEKQENEKAMWASANSVLSGLLIATGGLSLVAMLVITVFLQFDLFNADTRLMLELLRVMFPYTVLVCIAALFMAMLNSRGWFFLPAMGAAMLNLVMIFAVVFVAPHWGGELSNQIFALAFAVLLAGIVQAVFQLPALHREGFRLAWYNPLKSQAVSTVVRKMIPGTIGVAAFQINVLVTQGIAFWHDETIVAAFAYAVRLMEMPQGVFGISLATFLLPTLSGLAADKDYMGFRSTLRQGMGHLLFINLFASVMLVVLAEPIVRLLFERGEFDAWSTRRSAYALVFLAPGLIAFSLNNVLARAFYALGDTRIPMQIASFCLVLNIFLTLVFIFPMKEGGLGLANSITSSLNTGLLLYALKKKIKFLDLLELKKPVLISIIAALAAGLVGWLALDLIRSHFHSTAIYQDLAMVFVPLMVSGGVYLLIGWAHKHPTTLEFVSLFRKAK